MPLIAGVSIGADGNLPITTDAVGASALYVEGMAITNGELHTVDATSGVPAGALYRSGIARSANGAVYTTTATPSSGLFSRGFAVSSDGALHITTSDPDTGLIEGGVEVSSTGAVYVSTSAPDVTAPTLSSPQNGTETADGTELFGVTTDESGGTLYWAVLTDAGSATDAQLKAGTGGNIVSGASGNQVVSSSGAQLVTSVTGLSPSTAYELIFLHRDAAGNDSSQATIGFTTTAAPGGSTELQFNDSANSMYIPLI